MTFKVKIKIRLRFLFHLKAEIVTCANRLLKVYIWTVLFAK